MNTTFYVFSVNGRDNKKYYLCKYGTFSFELNLAQHFSSENVTESLHENVEESNFSALDAIIERQQWEKEFEKETGKKYRITCDQINYEKITFSEETTNTFSVDMSGNVVYNEN